MYDVSEVGEGAAGEVNRLPLSVIVGFCAPAYTR